MLYEILIYIKSDQNTLILRILDSLLVLLWDEVSGIRAYAGRTTCKMIRSALRVHKNTAEKQSCDAAGDGRSDVSLPQDDNLHYNTAIYKVCVLGSSNPNLSTLVDRQLNTRDMLSAKYILSLTF